MLTRGGIPHLVDHPTYTMFPEPWVIMQYLIETNIHIYSNAIFIHNHF